MHNQSYFFVALVVFFIGYVLSSFDIKWGRPVALVGACGFVFFWLADLLLARGF